MAQRRVPGAVTRPSARSAWWLVPVRAGWRRGRCDRCRVPLADLFAFRAEPRATLCQGCARAVGLQLRLSAAAVEWLTRQRMLGAVAARRIRRAVERERGATMRRSAMGQPLVLACENCGGVPMGLSDYAERPCHCPYDWHNALGGAVARYPLILVRDDRETATA